MSACYGSKGGEAVVKILRDVTGKDRISEVEPAQYGALLDALRA